MKCRSVGKRTSGAILGGLGVVAALVLSGCNRQESASSPDGPETAEVRGDPIQPPSSGVVAVEVTMKPDGPPFTSQEQGEVSVVAVDPPATVPTEPDAREVKVAAATEPAPTPATPVDTAGAQVRKDIGHPEKQAKGTPDEPLSVSFERLGAFQYDLPEGPVDTNVVVQADASKQIPPAIKALDTQFVSLRGFMLPLKVEKGLVTELLIMRDQSMCCYGTVPRINEWVSVKMVGDGVKPIMDQAVTLFGRLKVGEMYENGYLVGIYAMDGERMAGPLDM